MLGNFSYCNPTKLHFGPEALDALAGELAHYGKRVQLIYGGGSIKKNGVYDEITGLLHDAGKAVVEFSGIMLAPPCSDTGLATVRQHHEYRSPQHAHHRHDSGVHPSSQ